RDLHHQFLFFTFFFSFYLLSSIMKGLIFNVKRYSIHDGPGIRVTFFIKGCPLSCMWCHNPEGISPEQQKAEQIEKVGEKEFTRIEEVGKYYSVNDIIKILDKERIFIDESGGGVTFSGGEPLLQTEFMTEALKACRENGYNTAVDTSGYSPSENFKAVFPYTDLFLFDIKHMDDTRHIELTGVSNSLIMSNFKLILDSGKDIFIRVPVIPGLNDEPENLRKLKEFLVSSKTDNLKKISLLPFHKIGKSKYNKFNIPYRMNDVELPSRQRMNELKEYFSDIGIKVQIGG
ncbi:MAG: glycyl-radical enzyme activating protein, partial [Bacteroidia bacterium]|nr:glycyl-radical enzyme activating protein [Bacteroidia bacterium]